MAVTFNLQKFSADVKVVRGSKTQKQFAEELGLSSHTLISQFEEGKRAPSKEIFANFCSLAGKAASEYWVEEEETPVAFMMGRLGKEDNKNISELLDKIWVLNKKK